MMSDVICGNHGQDAAWEVSRALRANSLPGQSLSESSRQDEGTFIGTEEGHSQVAAAIVNLQESRHSLRRFSFFDS